MADSYPVLDANGTRIVAGAYDEGLAPPSSPLVGKEKQIVGAAAQTLITTNILESVAGVISAVSGYDFASIQIASTGTGGTFIFEHSNNPTDPLSWRPIPVSNAELPTAAPSIAAIAATVSQTIYTFPVVASHIRCRIVAAITGGSIRAFTVLSERPQVTGAVGLRAGAELIGDVNLRASASATGAVTLVSNLPAAAAGTNPTLVKAAAGRIYKVIGFNASASVKYLKIFSKVSVPIPGTDTAKFQIPLAPNAAFNIGFEQGNYVALGIGFAITGGPALNDGTAIVANDITGLSLHYV